MSLYLTKAEDFEATGFRQMDAVTVEGHGDQEFFILRVNREEKTVVACRITPSGRPGRKNYTFPVAKLTRCAWIDDC
jgi:hypothetical protein